MTGPPYPPSAGVSCLGTLDWPRWWWPTVVGVVALATVPRLIWAVIVPVEPVSDGVVYELLARNLWSGNGYAFEAGRPTAYWPVGTSAIYATLFSAFGPGYGPVVVLNVALGVAAVALTMILSGEWFGPRAGLVAGLILAAWPGQVMFVTILASELPFNACYLIGLWTSTRYRWPSVARVIVVGAASAAASYVRPIALLLPLVFAWCQVIGPGAWRRPRLAIVEVVGSMVVMAALIAPWSVRNTRAFGRPVLISTNGGANLWMGNNPASDGAYMALPDQIAEMDEARRDALLGDEAKRFIACRPVSFATRTLVKLIRTHDRETIGVVWNEPGLQRSFGHGVVLPLKAIGTAYWAAAMVLGLAGAVIALLRSGWRWLGQPAVVLWAYFAVLHAVIVSGDRYHYPSVPMIAALAGLGAVALLEHGMRLTPKVGPSHLRPVMG